jgi:nicotinate-nucleotide pyrophosphorylase (carboxylating)
MILNDIPHIDRLIAQALAEDLGDGDHSALACIPPDAMGSAKLLVKEHGILAGVALAERIFDAVDNRFELDIALHDGAHCTPGDVAFVVHGPSQKLLSAERLVLNFMQRLSGVASQTHAYVAAIAGTNTKVLDTRKTTPGLRYLEKWAVTVGGGYNHRIGLFDMIMLKDNHNDFAGGIARAIAKTHAYLHQTGRNLKIEVETRNLDEVKEVLETGGINRIMLDNFSLEETREAVALINRQYETESSGGITLQTIRDYAECGVDFISVGALTHSVKSLDLSLKAL